MSDSTAPSMISSNTCILKVSMRCKLCERDVKKLLEEIEGIEEIEINGKQGLVVIRGDVNSGDVLSVLAQARKRADLLWEQIPAKKKTKKEEDEDNLQIVAQRKGPKAIENNKDHEIDHEVESIALQLSGMKGAKHVEFTKARTVRVSFEGENGGIGETTALTETNTIVVDDGYGVSRRSHGGRHGGVHLMGKIDEDGGGTHGGGGGGCCCCCCQVSAGCCGSHSQHQHQQPMSCGVH